MPMPLRLMQLGEVVYGGVQSGLYGMLAFVFIAVFVAYDLEFCDSHAQH